MDDEILFTEEPPEEELANRIVCYWHVRNDTPKSVTFPVVPDGCMDIIRIESTRQNGLFLVGPMSCATVVTIEPGDRFFGIRFAPGALAALIGGDARKLTDTTLPLESISPSLYHTLAFLKRETPETGRLDRLFSERFADSPVDPLVQKAVAMIMACEGNTNITAVAKELGLSERQLERRFPLSVGYSPKRFARIYRFFAAHKRLCEEGTAGLSRTAHDLGYCDQPHFNRDYKAFTLFTPTDGRMSLFYNTSSRLPVTMERSDTRRKR